MTPILTFVSLLAGDLSWGSAGCYGAAGVQTPHIDRFACEGRRG